jgi:hypothetical protein
MASGQWHKGSWTIRRPLMKKISFLLVVFLLAPVFSSSAWAKPTPLDSCVTNYCDYTCKTVAFCNYIGSSGIRSCKSGCIRSSRSSLGKLKSSKRLSSCRSGDRKIRQLNCTQLGQLLGYRGGTGGGKK